MRGWSIFCGSNVLFIIIIITSYKLFLKCELISGNFLFIKMVYINVVYTRKVLFVPVTLKMTAYTLYAKCGMGGDTMLLDINWYEIWKKLFG